MMRTSVRSLPALLGILATAALSADVNDKKDKRLTADLTSSGRMRRKRKRGWCASRMSLTDSE